MILVPAPINQLVVRDGKVYFTTYTETESNLVSYDVATDEIKTLFTSEKMLLFPDIK
jgi:hypothetical protein